MNELTYLTEDEKIKVLGETIPKIRRLQAELKLAKERVTQLNKDEAELLVWRLRQKEYKEQIGKLINTSEDTA
jgi:small-conductance mechanosensitive channel